MAVRHFLQRENKSEEARMVKVTVELPVGDAGCHHGATPLTADERKTIGMDFLPATRCGAESECL